MVSDEAPVTNTDTTVQAHFWTWTTPPEELARGIDHCPSVSVENVTTTDMRNHGQAPAIFHLGRDPVDM